MKSRRLLAAVLAICAGPASASADWGFDTSAMDRSIRPGDDFFRFTNGAWLDQTGIPADKVSVGLIPGLSDRVAEQLETLVADIASHPEASGSEAKIGRFYRGYMDQARLNQLGWSPAHADLTRVREIGTKDALAGLAGSATSGFAATPFPLSIDPDAKDPRRYTIEIDQGGLGLPDRDYYLKPDFAEERAAYAQYVASSLAHIGWPEPARNAGRIVAFETRIAEVSWTSEQRRDSAATYRPIKVGVLERFAPGFAWRSYLGAAGLGRREMVVLDAGNAIPAIARIWASTPLDVLKAWEAFHFVDNASPYLSADFSRARFQFRAGALTGQRSEEPRSRQAINILNARLGELVGRAYVERYFAPAAKASIEGMALELKQAFRARLQALDWLGPRTKAEALRKLDLLTIKIGYPDHWRNFDGLSIRSDDLYGDVARARAFDWHFRVSRLREPVDRAEWLVPPQSISAYSNPQFNEIAFPAAKLQAPYFDPNADRAINYGAIGAVIGHEMTHGFDDQGRAFDGEGRLRDWWTPADAAAFEARAHELVAQYSLMEPLPGIHIRGERTVGENMADLGGLLIAFDAYRASLHGRPAPVIDGFSGKQRVFLGWAQIWRAKWRAQALRHDIETDEHAPFEARVNGVVRNIDAWYPLFGVGPANKLYLPREKRVRIW
jgi:putative endopeptidase